MSKIAHHQDDTAAPDEYTDATSKSGYPGYDVGYKRPPRHTQFKRGQSGNPKGRAKGVQNHRTTLSRVVNEKVSVREGDKTRRMTKFEAMLQAHTLKGMKADTRSALVILNLLSKTRLLGDEEDAINESNVSQSITCPLDFLLQHVESDRLTKDEQIELGGLIGTVDHHGMTALSATEFDRFKQLIDKGEGKPPPGA
jgi:Family of unknown function (DUF5681)